MSLTGGELVAGANAITCARSHGEFTNIWIGPEDRASIVAQHYKVWWLYSGSDRLRLGRQLHTHCPCQPHIHRVNHTCMEILLHIFLGTDQICFLRGEEREREREREGEGEGEGRSCCVELQGMVQTLRCATLNGAS
jgi:hypothetical protein